MTIKYPIFLEIKKSGVSGRGVFTNKALKKFERICFMRGEEIDIHEMCDRVEEGSERSADPLGVDDERYIDLEKLPRSINHSCEPNAFIRVKNELVAMRAINENEEITFDYSTTMNDNKEIIEASNGILWWIKCKCGAKKCRGRIDQFKTLPVERQKFYVKNKFAPDFILKAFAQVINT